MGWASATEIFDPVVKEILAMKAPAAQKRKVIKILITHLEDGDWDTQSESKYYNHALVRKVFEECGHTYEEDGD